MATNGRPLWLVTVTRKDGSWAVFKNGKRISTNFKKGREALEHAIAQGWQAGYRGLTYNDGGYLNGVKAEAQEDEAETCPDPACAAPMTPWNADGCRACSNASCEYSEYEVARDTTKRKK